MSPHGAVRLRTAVTVAACGAALLWATASTPVGALAEARAALTTSPAGADPFAAVVPVAALVAWALTGWLTATVALTLAGRLPGITGRCASGAVRRIAPRAVRRAVELALGLGLAAGATCAGSASAAPLAAAEAPRPAAGELATPSLDWPTGGAPVSAPAAPAPPAVGEVVVAPGDTLWALAERALGPGATTQQVAAAWPAWWAANRDVIGADPDLIHPGDRLTPPSDLPADPPATRP